jgi:hypothetical protein
VTDSDGDNDDDDDDDKSKVMCCTWKDKEYCFQYLTLFSVSQQMFANLTHRQLFEKKLFTLVAGPYTALGSHAFTTLFPSTDIKFYIGKYRIIRSIMYYVL